MIILTHESSNTISILDALTMAPSSGTLAKICLKYCSPIDKIIPKHDLERQKKIIIKKKNEENIEPTRFDFYQSIFEFRHIYSMISFSFSR